MSAPKVDTIAHGGYVLRLWYDHTMPRNWARWQGTICNHIGVPQHDENETFSANTRDALLIDLVMYCERLRTVAKVSAGSPLLKRGEVT